MWRQCVVVVEKGPDTANDAGMCSSVCSRDDMRADNMPACKHICVGRVCVFSFAQPVMDMFFSRST